MGDQPTPVPQILRAVLGSQSETIREVKNPLTLLVAALAIFASVVTLFLLFRDGSATVELILIGLLFFLVIVVLAIVTVLIWTGRGSTLVLTGSQQVQMALMGTSIQPESLAALEARPPVPAPLEVVSPPLPFQLPGPPDSESD
jgi:hypothetical protein